MAINKLLEGSRAEKFLTRDVVPKNRMNRVRNSPVADPVTRAAKNTVDVIETTRGDPRAVRQSLRTFDAVKRYGR